MWTLALDVFSTAPNTIMNTFQIGMSVVGLNVYLVNVFSGVLLLIALAFDFVQRRRSGRL